MQVRAPLTLLGALAVLACSGAEEKRGEARDAYPGNDLALPVPAETDGFQLHFGPADPDDPGEVAQFVIAPGNERVRCVYAEAPNDQEAYFSSYDAALRPGTHHLLVNAAKESAVTGTVTDCTLAEPAELFLLVQGGVGPEGARLAYPLPPVAPENEGVAHRLPARQTLGMQAHFVNTTEEPLLGEAWVNVLWHSPDQVQVVSDSLTLYAGLGMSIPPHSRQLVRGACAGPEGATEPIRVLDLFGHMHSHGKRISAWHVAAEPSSGESRTAIYRSYEWAELERYSFDSRSSNPPVEGEPGRGGAMSGVLTMRPGDRIEFECEFDNTEDFPLTFEAETFTAEMCGLIGNYAPAPFGLWFCGVN